MQAKVASEYRRSGFYKYSFFNLLGN